MEPSAKYSFLDGNDRIALSLELDGRAVVDVMTLDGEVLKTHEDEIDPRDSERLVSELFDVAPKLPVRPDGEIWVRLEQNGEVWDYAFSEYDVPHRGLDVDRIMRTIASDVLNGRLQRSARRQGGPQQAQMTMGGFAKWAAMFSGGFIAAMFVGWLGMFAASSIGPISLAVSFTLSGFMMTGSFWTVGRKFGEHYRGAFPVWPVALVGCAPFIYLYWEFGGAPSVRAIVGMLTMPIWAYMGERYGY